MGAYSHLLDTGELPGPYRDEHAELFARCALVDEAEFERLIDRPDGELAEHFGVPVAQVGLKRGGLV